jgi:hypothetical protein
VQCADDILPMHMHVLSTVSLDSELFYICVVGLNIMIN